MLAMKYKSEEIQKEENGKPKFENVANEKPKFKKKDHKKISHYDRKL